ncbi:MAG: diacylglycerol kinase family protein [Pseudomonadota bacterium]
MSALPIQSLSAPSLNSCLPHVSRELFIVFNPGSGSQDKDEARKAITAAFDEAHCTYRFIEDPSGDVQKACAQAARLAGQADGVLVAVGGDGTISAAAQAAYDQDCVLGVIAQGTFNMFSRDHGLPQDPGEAAQLVTKGHVRGVQAGLINRQIFLVNASVGLYPKILADREDVKQKLGRKRWVALLAALKSLFGWRSRLHLDIELDGQLRKLTTPSVFICNNSMQLERVGINGAVTEAVGNGRLAGIVTTHLDMWAKVRLVAAAIRGKLDEEPEVVSFSMRSLKLAARHARRLKVAVDGEVHAMQLPIQISVAARPLRVMLPAS